MCVRLLLPYETYTGAHVKPVIDPVLMRRLYAFTVDAVIAQIAGAWRRMPAMNW